MSGNLINIIQHLGAGHRVGGAEQIIPAFKLETLLNEEFNVVLMDAAVIVAKRAFKFNFSVTFNADRGSSELRRHCDNHKYDRPRCREQLQCPARPGGTGDSKLEVKINAHI